MNTSIFCMCFRIDSGIFIELKLKKQLKKQGEFYSPAY